MTDDTKFQAPRTHTVFRWVLHSGVSVVRWAGGCGVLLIWAKREVLRGLAVLSGNLLEALPRDRTGKHNFRSTAGGAYAFGGRMTACMTWLSSDCH